MFLLSCNKNESISSESIDKDAVLNFSIKTRSVNDPLIKGGDGSFSSLALFIFNKANGYCEYSELIPSIPNHPVNEFSKSVNVSSQTKVIYAIANYNDPSKTFSIPISSNLTIQQLEDLTVTTSSFSDNNILMIGKKEEEINNQYVIAEVPMERLVARLDIYLFKSAGSLDNIMNVKSIEFVNQILNSNCRYQLPTMLTPINKTNVITNITNNTTLQLMPSDLTGIIPQNAHTSFYSYQNIASSIVAPDDNITPYLSVVINIDGRDHTYKGYIADNGQTTNKYSLMRNKVYRVMAMADKLDNELIVNASVLPWSVTSSGIGHEVKDTYYSFNALNSDPEALSCIVQYPYISNGIGIDASSYASYSFTLTAPVGAIWTATLTNGLDFTFNSVGSISGKSAVSQGIARTDAYEIKVGATKSWGGNNRSTYLYVTVNGEKLKINPVGSNSLRKFPGTNDTDILITQTKSQ